MLDSYREKNMLLKYGIYAYIPLSFLAPLMMYQMRDNNRLIVMDAKNTYHISEYTSDKDRLVRMYKRVGRTAVESFLMRGPFGMDNAELFEDMFDKDGEARKTVLKLVSDEAGQFKKFDIHQKCEVMDIKVIEADSKKSFVEVNGQLIRSYIKNGEKNTYTVEFTAKMDMLVNFDMGRNAIYPFIVSKLEYVQKEVRD